MGIRQRKLQKGSARAPLVNPAAQGGSTSNRHSVVVRIRIRGDGITSTASPATSNSSVHRTTSDLWDDNEKLKQANHLLSTELAQAKRQYSDLMAIMTEHLKLGVVGGRDADTDDDKLRKKLKKGEEDGREGLKLVGVRLKVSNGDLGTNVLIKM